MSKEDIHEKRSNEIADVLRRFLVGIHTGGIASLLTFASSMSEHGILPKWIILPNLFFCFGLLIVGISLNIAKHREIKRKKAILENKQPPDYSKLLWRSQTWEVMSLALFLAGLITGLRAINSMNFY